LKEVVEGSKKGKMLVAISLIPFCMVVRTV